MGTSVTLNGTSYTIPAVGEGNWGTEVTNYLIALASGVLTKSGGSFTLTADVDFGANYGLEAPFFAGRSTPATAGLFRLGNTEVVSWRDQANSANLDLTVNSSDALVFDGNPINTLALGAAHTVMRMNAGGTATEYALIDNNNVDASAAIAYSKLNLATSIVNADVSASAAIAYSKLNLATSIVNADVSASAAIAYSKLAALTSANILVGNGSNVATSVTMSGAITLDNAGAASLASSVVYDTNVHVDAAIDRAKLASGSVDHVVIHNGSGELSSEATLDKSRGGAGADMTNVTFPSGTKTIATLEDAQSFTEIKTHDKEIKLQEITTPASNPATGYRSIYPKADGKFYHLDDAGIEQELGSGGGAGEINYVADSSDAEDNTIGDWVTYADAAGATPVDGDGGSPTHVAITAQNTTVLRGSYSYKLAKSTGDAQGEGIALPFTVPKADLRKLVKIEMDYNTDSVSGTAYADGDLACYVYDVTNGALITPNVVDFDDYDKDDDGSGKFYVTFQTTDATSYRLLIHVASASTGVWDMYFDKLIVGPGLRGLGEHVEDKILANYATNAGLSVATTTDVLIDFEDKIYDVGSDTDNVTTGTGWKFTAPRDGKFSFSMMARLSSSSAWAATEFAQVKCYKNSALFSRDIQYPYVGSAASISVLLSHNVTIDLVAGDYVQFYVYQTSDATLTLDADSRYNRISITEITDKRTGLNLISDSLVNANNYCGFKDTAADSMTAGIYNLVKFTTHEFGNATDYNSSTGVWTAPYTGRVRINAAVECDSTATAFLWGIIKVNDSGTTADGATKFGTRRYGAIGADVTATIEVTKGDAVSFHLYPSAVGVNLGTTATRNYISFERASEFTAGQAVGFAGATPTNTGLVRAEKQYTDSDVTFSSTPTGWSLARAVFVPYQTYDGAWRMKFNIAATITGATTASTTIDGVTFKDVANFYQPLAVMSANLDALRAFTQPGEGRITMTGTSTTAMRVSGDVELDSKPTWAD